MLTTPQIWHAAATAAVRYLYEPEFAANVNTSPEPFRATLHEAGFGHLDCEEHQADWDAVVTQLDRYVSGDDQMILSAARQPVEIGQLYSWCPWSPGNPIIRHGEVVELISGSRVTMRLLKEWEIDENKWLERVTAPAVTRLFAAHAYQLFPLAAFISPPPVVKPLRLVS